MSASYLDLGFPTRLIGRQVLYHARLASTSSRILEFARDPAQDGLVVLADEQLTGRGTRGRHWFCPPSSGLLFSVLLFPPPELRRPVYFSTLAGVAVCEAISTHVQRQAYLKWPNDVLVRGLKVSGILIEQHPVATVLGIGVNVDISEAEFLAQGLPEAGSLAALATTPLHRMDLLRTLLTRLDEHYAELCAGRVADLEARWRDYSGLMNRQVVAQVGEEVLLGRLLEMRFDKIELRTMLGQVRHFRAEELDRLTPLQ